MAYQSDYGNRMANLAMRRGEQEAQSAVQRGNVYAELAQAPSETMENMLSWQARLDNQAYMQGLRQEQQARMVAAEDEAFAADYVDSFTTQHGGVLNTPPRLDVRVEGPSGRNLTPGINTRLQHQHRNARADHIQETQMALARASEVSDKMRRLHAGFVSQPHQNQADYMAKHGEEWRALAQEMGVSPPPQDLDGDNYRQWYQANESHFLTDPEVATLISEASEDEPPILTGRTGEDLTNLTKSDWFQSVNAQIALAAVGAHGNRETWNALADEEKANTIQHVSKTLYEHNPYDTAQLDLIRKHLDILSPKYIEEVVLQGPEIKTDAKNRDEFIHREVLEYNKKNGTDYGSIAELAVASPDTATRINLKAKSIFDAEAPSDASSSAGTKNLYRDVVAANTTIRNLEDERVRFNPGTIENLDWTTEIGTSPGGTSGGGSIQVPRYEAAWDTQDGWKYILDFSADPNNPTAWRDLNRRGALDGLNEELANDGLAPISERKRQQLLRAQERWSSRLEQGAVKGDDANLNTIAQFFQQGDVKPLSVEIEQIELRPRMETGGLLSRTDDGHLLVFARDRFATHYNETSEGEAKSPEEWTDRDGRELFNKLLNDDKVLSDVILDYYNRIGVARPPHNLKTVRTYLQQMTQEERDMWLSPDGRYPMGRTYEEGWQYPRRITDPPAYRSQ